MPVHPQFEPGRKLVTVYMNNYVGPPENDITRVKVFSEYERPSLTQNQYVCCKILHLPNTESTINSKIAQFMGKSSAYPFARLDYIEFAMEKSLFIYWLSIINTKMLLLSPSFL